MLSSRANGTIARNIRPLASVTVIPLGLGGGKCLLYPRRYCESIVDEGAVQIDSYEPVVAFRAHACSPRTISMLA